MNAKTLRVGLKSYLPSFDWLPYFKSEWLPFDIIAVLSVWALHLPRGVADSPSAGVPSQYGLYTAPGSRLGYALFGTSGQVVTGPIAVIAALSGSVITLWATAGTNEWIAHTATLAVFTGLVYILLGVLRKGWISHFLSGAILGGFVFRFGIGSIVDHPGCAKGKVFVNL